MEEFFDFEEPEQAKVGLPAPKFHVASTKSMQTLDEDVTLDDYKGQWLILFFYPLDFTFVCPTEITAFSDRIDDIRKLGADVLGISTDSKYSHRAWINTPRDRGGLGEIGFVLGSDMTRNVSQAYGVLDEEQGFAQRGLFLIDPDGILRYLVVHDSDVGRNVDETLRVLQALQTGGLCPAGWQPGQPTLESS
jgi:peroxiredoxin 2/4